MHEFLTQPKWDGMAPSGDYIGQTRRDKLAKGSVKSQKSMPPASQSPVPSPSGVVRFGVFEADLQAGELRKNGVRVKIQDLPFRALRLLLKYPNEVLSRDQFRQALWPAGVFVDFDHGISSAINRLRDALGDSADNPVFIETVERKGYRWVAPTHLPAVPASAPAHPPVVTAPPAAGPVLVRREIVEVPFVRGTRFPGRWVWLLALPAAALVIAALGFRPFHRPAQAASITASGSSRAETAASPGSEAQQFYLKGRFYWQTRTPENLNKAVDQFTQAIVHDPNYAPAYVGLADCYNLMREYTLMPASEAYPRALAAAKKAVELDERSSEAHASLAFALFWGSWQVSDADREFRRAIELDPNNAVAHHWFASYLTSLDRPHEALAEMERAQALDPSSKAILADKGNLLGAVGRTTEGETLLKQLEAAEPGFMSPHRYLKSMYYAQADYNNYFAEWKKEAELMHDPASLKLLDAAQKSFASRGVRGMLEAERSEEQRLYDRGQQSAYSLAQTDAMLGNRNAVFQHLQASYDKHEEYIVNLKIDSAFNAFRDDPAYKDLLARIGLPPNTP